MALFNYATKEITLKIVYYGPGLSGKTTNIEYLHSTFDPKRRGKLLSLSTEADRTLFFDFLPVEIGKIKDFSIRFQLYTVPGQVRYNSTRKLVLKGADAVVFIADSQREMKDANVESLENMKENLIENDLDIEDIPLVFQFNKRDLPNVLGIEELNRELNPRNNPYFESVAIEGKGVQETFQATTKQLLKHISRKHKVDIESRDPKSGARAPEAPSAPRIPEPSPIEGTPVRQAIRADDTKGFDFEEVIEAEPVTPSIAEETELAEIPSLEDLQRQLSRDLDDNGTVEAKSIPSLSRRTDEVEEIQEEAIEEAHVVEEPSSASIDAIDEHLDLVHSEFENTSSAPSKDLPGHAEVMIDSTIREFEPEASEEDTYSFAEEDLMESAQEDAAVETPFEDDSIESIYKAFMSDEEENVPSEDPSIKAKSTPPPAVPPEQAPNVEINENISYDTEVPLEPEGSAKPPYESVEELSPPAENREKDALKAFGDSITHSFETSKRSFEGPITPREERSAPGREQQATMSEGTKNVILDEINSLSRVINKMNSSISSFKSELNVLSDKMLDMDRRLSEIRGQTSEMQETLNDGSGSGTRLTSETLHTIMELKKSIDKAKKKKFWLFFS